MLTCPDTSGSVKSQHLSDSLSLSVILDCDQRAMGSFSCTYSDCPQNLAEQQMYTEDFGNIEVASPYTDPNTQISSSILPSIWVPDLFQVLFLGLRIQQWLLHVNSVPVVPTQGHQPYETW